MALFNFLKREDGNFYQWFEDAAANMLLASQALQEICRKMGSTNGAVSQTDGGERPSSGDQQPVYDLHSKVDEIHEYEHRGDEIGHRIYEALNQSFVTPLDREDIIRLYSSIDDVTDLVHSAADMMSVYKVDSVPHTAVDLAECIVGCAEEVVKALPHLRKRNELNQIQPSVIQINSLENRADDLLRDGLVELFSDPVDVVHIIKWRDIYQEMEEATDKAEDISDVLRGLVIKHA